MNQEVPVYSHNPYHATKFPLLVLDVNRRVCIPSNEGFRVLHWHEEVQFVYVLKGIVCVRIYDEEFDLSPGDCMFINRSVLHQIMEKEDCRYHSFIIPSRMFSFFSGSIMEQEDVLPVVNNPTLTHCFINAEEPSHSVLLTRIRELDDFYFSPRKEPHREYLLSIKIAEIWLELLAALPPVNTLAPVKSYARVQSMISFIHTNYSRQVSLDEIAASAHISQAECLRCFRKFVRCSPYQYLMQYRLHMSTSLLLTTDASVTEIALNVGFRSASSYIKYFRACYHTTPARYKNSRET